MEWNQLVGFYHVALLGSYTKAAKETFRTQSALSQQIKRLEEGLGTTLFDRSGRGCVHLTASGQALFQYAQIVLSQEERFMEELAEIKGESKGFIRLTAPNGTLIFQLAGPLKRYREEFPDVHLHLFESAPQTSVDMVLDGSMDLCVTHESVIPQSFMVYPWASGRYVIMAPHGHPLTRLDRVTMDDIVKYPLILPQKNARRTARRNFDWMATQESLRYKIILETSNTSINADYVKAGFGISFILSFDSYRRLHGKDIAFLFMDDIFPPERISIGVKKGHVLSPTKQKFLDFLLRNAPPGDLLPDGFDS
jgi:DNA-binding transcriptional LysR family regulator